jgi:hypothetical protein
VGWDGWDGIKEGVVIDKKERKKGRREERKKERTYPRYGLLGGRGMDGWMDGQAELILVGGMGVDGIGRYLMDALFITNISWSCNTVFEKLALLLPRCLTIPHIEP